MNKEDKELLIKDLCARLPYGVKCSHFMKSSIGPSRTLESISTTSTFGIELNDGENMPKRVVVDEVKPYLRPMSSMTEDEFRNYDLVASAAGCGLLAELCCDVMDWLNARHFDYRGLIEKGLALEAPEGMYDLKEE